VGRPYRIGLYPKVDQRPTSGHEKKVISQSDRIHAMATPLYRTLQSTLEYDTVIRRTSVIGCMQQL